MSLGPVAVNCLPPVGEVPAQHTLEFCYFASEDLLQDAARLATHRALIRQRVYSSRLDLEKARNAEEVGNARERSLRRVL
jgi:hypothetical protein